MKRKNRKLKLEMAERAELEPLGAEKNAFDETFLTMENEIKDLTMELIGLIVMAKALDQTKIHLLHKLMN